MLYRKPDSGHTIINLTGKRQRCRTEVFLRDSSKLLSLEPPPMVILPKISKYLSSPFAP